MALMKFERRQIAVPQALTSWDNCMADSYCKWPVIAGCIIGGFIVLSIVWCIASCLCCSASCCCSCARCCSCCAPRRSRKLKYSHDESAYRSQPNNGYVHPSPQGFQHPPSGYHASPAQPTYESPQSANFDARRDNQPGRKTSSPVNEDALPIMPSWETAPSRKVLVEGGNSGEAVELDVLHPGVPERKPLAPNFSPMMSGAILPSPVLRSSQIGSPYQNSFHPARDVHFESSMAHHQNQHFSPQSSYYMYTASPPLHSQPAHPAYEDRSQHSVSPVPMQPGGPSFYQPQRSPKSLYPPLKMPQEPIHPHHYSMDNDGYSDAEYGATRRPAQSPYSAHSASQSHYMR